MGTFFRVFWLPVCIFGVFFSQLLVLFLLMVGLYKIGFTPLKHIYIVLYGTEEEVMKLDKSQGGVYDFTHSRTCYRKADRIAQKYIATGSIEEQGVRKRGTFKVRF